MVSWSNATTKMLTIFRHAFSVVVDCGIVMKILILKVNTYNENTVGRFVNFETD